MHVREPQQDRGFARRDAVLAGAADIFDRFGYGQASLKQISTASGATIGSVYFYFSTKESIALSVIEEQNRRTFAAFQEISGTHLGMDALVRTSKAVADLLLVDVVVRAGIRLSLEQGTFEAPTAEFYRDWMAGLVPAFQEARDSGELASTLTLPQLARTLVPYFTGVHLVSNVLTGRAELYDDLRSMWEVFLHGVVAPEHITRLSGLVAKLFTTPQPDAVTLNHPGSSE